MTMSYHISCSAKNKKPAGRYPIGSIQAIMSQLGHFSHERAYSVWLLRQSADRSRYFRHAIGHFWQLLLVLALTTTLATFVRADVTQNLAQVQAQGHGHPLEVEPRKWCVRHLLEREYAHAVMDCGLAIKKGEQIAESFSNLSAALILLKQYAEAEAAATKAIKVDPRNAIHYFNRGLSFDLRKRFQEAIANYSAAIRLDPRLVSAYTNRGLAWHQLGEYAKAREDVRHAGELLKKRKK